MYVCVHVYYVSVVMTSNKVTVCNMIRTSFSHFPSMAKKQQETVSFVKL